jgi:hypothetical protein
MINSDSFFFMAPLNLLQTVYPKALRKSAFIFCIIRPRWAFTVISLMPSSLPDSPVHFIDRHDDNWSLLCWRGQPPKVESLRGVDSALADLMLDGFR